MSPAMVEPPRTLADASSSSKLKPQRSRYKGQIFTSQSPSPLDPAGIPSFTRSMDPPPPPFAPHPPPASGKPSPAPGLSKPRFLKMRKHQASPRARAAAAPDGRAAPGFNPFRPGDDGGAQVLRERLDSWRPFVSVAGSKVSEIPNTQSAGFVFGDASQLNLGIGKSEAADFVFTGGKDREGSGNAGTVGSATGVSKSANLGWSSSESLASLNSGSFGSVRSESAGFASGASSTLDLNSRSDVGGNAVGGVPSFMSGRNPSSEAGAFALRSAAKGSGNLSRNSSLGSDDGLFPPLADEMRKMKLQTFGNEDVLRQKKQSDWRSHTGTTDYFVFGGGKSAPREGSGCPDAAGGSDDSLFSRLPDDMRKMKLQNFGHEEVLHQKKQSDWRSNTGTSGSDDSLFSRLPDDMRKMKLQNFGHEEVKQSDWRSNTGTSCSFVFGVGKNAPGEGSEGSDAAGGSDGGLSSQLPDEMRKMKLQTFGNEEVLHQKMQSDWRSNNSTSGSFVFGAGKNAPSEGSGDPDAAGGSDDGLSSQLPDETRKMKLQTFGNEEVLQQKTQSDWSSNAGTSGSFVLLGGKNAPSEGSGGPDAAGGSDEGLFSRLPNEMRKMKSQTFGNEEVLHQKKQSDLRSNTGMRGSFVFGVGKNAPSEGSGGPDAAGVFEFGSGTKNSYSLSRESSLGTNEDSYSFPEEMRKLKLQSGNDDNIEKAKRSDQRSKENNAFIVGGNKNVPPDNSRNSDKDAFIFGRGLDNISSSSQKLSTASDKGSYYQLREEIRKLKIDSTGKEDGAERVKQANDKPKIAENNTFHSGCDYNVSCTGNLKSDGGPFLFGSGLRNNSNINGNLVFGFDEGSFSRLPDEMRKLNLQNSSNEVCFQNVKHVGAENNTSKFGGIATKKLPEEMKELNIGLERTFNQTKDGSADLAADGFVFKSGLKTNSVSSQILDSSFGTLKKSTALDIPDDVVNINGQGSRGCHDSKNTDSNFVRKVDLGSGFVFESGNKAYIPFAGSMETALPSDTENTESGNVKQKPVGSTGLIFQQDSMTASAEIPFKYSFQKGIHDNSSSTGAIPQENVHGHSTPGSVTISASYASLDSTYSQSVGADFTFSGLQEKVETPHVEIGTENQGTFCFSKESLFTSSRRSGTKTRRRRGKSRQPAPIAKQSISRGTVGHENPDHESPGDYSPMDYSPYRENLVADQCSAEPSISSEEHLSSYGASTDLHVSASVDVIEEDLVTAAQRMDINNDELENRGLDEYCYPNSGSSFVDKRNCGPGNDNQTPKGENIVFGIGSKVAAVEGETGVFSLNVKREASESGKMFTSCSLEDQSERKFTFAASPSASVSRRTYRRKSRTSAGQESSDFMPSTKIPLASSSIDFIPIASNAVHPDPLQGLSGVPFVSKNENENRATESKRPEVSREPKGTAAVSIAGHEACEKWRLRGNQAYSSGHMSKAEDYYTRGVNSISSGATCKSSLRALMLCYSNRAATRMSLGRMREAVSDCKMAISIDPNFLRAQVRAANCHLAQGETADALMYFQKCLHSKNGANCDQKIIIEASEGLDNAQKVADCMVQSEELLLKKTMNDATKALQLLSEALLISPFSERLMELKMEALVKLRSYEEAIQLCEQTLDAAEKNSVSTNDVGQLKDVDSSEYGSSLEKLWRWRIISKSNFYLGKLEEALELLQKHEKVKPIVDKFGNRLQESSTSLSATIRELLRLKAAGNEAFQEGRHLEAVEHYTAALACSTESRPFAAICFCNRAAAYQALGQITDAIADCSLAIALDGSYPKAISRRATLHEVIRDYEQAANDLNRLVSLLEKQVEDKDNVSGAPSGSTANSTSLKQARLRLLAVEEEARKETPLDMYKILGIEPSSSAADVKKAYRKAALRHHPDKAGHSLTKSENVDDGLWREVAAEVHIGADRLFKMIGEAYTMLSDPNKRLQYDAEEEMKSQRKSYSGNSMPKTHSDSYNSQYDRNTSRRQWQPYGSSNQRWSEYSREYSRSYK